MDKLAIGDRMKKLRLEAGYTQFVVAEYIHINQKTYSDYELGKTLIPVPNLIKFAELMDASMDYLCCLTDERSSYPSERDLSDFHPYAVQDQKYI